MSLQQSLYLSSKELDPLLKSKRSPKINKTPRRSRHLSTLSGDGNFSDANPAIRLLRAIKDEDRELSTESGETLAVNGAASMSLSLTLFLT